MASKTIKVSPFLTLWFGVTSVFHMVPESGAETSSFPFASGAFDSSSELSEL